MRNKFNQIPKPKPKAVAAVNPAVAKISADLLQHGFALDSAGQIGQAKLIYEEILKLNPKHFHALQLLGAIAVQTQQWDKALKLLTDALAINNTSASVYNNRGIVLQELKRLEEALASYNKAIEYKRDFIDAYSNRGIVLQELKRFEEALVSYDKAIEFKYDFAEAYYNRGIVLNELKRKKDALLSYEKAIEFKRDFAEAYLNRGIALKEINRFEDSLASYDKSIEFKHNYAEAYSNRGNVLKELMRLKEALLSYDKAIEIESDHADTYWDKSLALLLGGDFDKGFNEYEWRWKKDNFTSPKRNFSQPLWLGAEDIAGKTILLHAEQGLGDTIQFCRYAKLVAELGAKVILEVQKPLVNLLQSLTGVSQLVAKGSALPEFDYQCPLLSLPLAFKTELKSIPIQKAYLKSSTAKLDVWSKRLGEKSKPRIGLVWSGSTIHKNDHNRSLTLNDVLKHLPPNFEYVSLQKEVREGDKDALTNTSIKHYGDQLVDFSDTAALCDLMDIVISVDTSVAHLAGALGKTTWILLPYVPDWRWLLDRYDSPWYSSVNLYRQDEDRQYAPVLEQVANDLLKISSIT